jgi:choline kinase
MTNDHSSAANRRPAAIILAAGVGRRLGSKDPKVLLRFGGRTLLERHIITLHAEGVTDIALTVGHETDLVRGELRRLQLLDRVALIENPRYREGSIVSLWAQQAWLTAGREALLMDGDVLYDHRMIARLLAAAPENVLLLDRAIEPGDEPVKICISGNRIVDFAKRPVEAHDWHGESVGFFRFSAAMAAVLAARADAYMREGSADLEYEAVIRDLILAHPDRFGCEDISDLPWTEIDFPEDVVRARHAVLPRLMQPAHA